MKTILEELAELSKAIEDKMIALEFKDEVDKILQDPANEGKVYLVMLNFLYMQYDATRINLENLLSRADDKIKELGGIKG
jgi:hypothetical protein